MVSDWMVNGNLSEFVKNNPNANRLELVRISLGISLSRLIIRLPIQLGDVAKGLIYIHHRGMIHGDLKGVCF